LILEEPARFWENTAISKTRLWQAWLLIFAALVILPVGVGLYKWDVFAEAVSRITSPNSSAFSLAGLAAITVPALFYAWLLKNVSRVFIQNLNLADDASHRRALAITYLGLSENPKLSISDADRALVLNALFRPIPPHSTDEGPPSGLMDLIRGKSS
jgi:Family of unknown function (DUF6161)